jgi:Tol biopolymer transport system component
MVAPFDIETLDLTGPALPVAEGLLLVGSGSVANVGLSDSGRLIYHTGDSAGRLATPVWVDRRGIENEIIPGWKMLSDGGVGIPSLSPQGDRIAIAMRTLFGVTGADIWIGSLDGLQSRITFGGQRTFVPSWTPDGQSVVYSEFGTGGSFSFWTKRADGSGSPQLLLENQEQIRKGFISRDGEWLLFRDLPAGLGTGRIRAYRIGSNEPALTLVDSDFSVGAPALSPDGRWLAYASDESGRWEVYVQPFPDINSGRWQVSTTGGTGPSWAHSMQELFYVNGDSELVTVDIDTNNSFSWGAAQSLFPVDDYRTAVDSATYDVDTDDQRFLMMRLGEINDSELIMVDNWFAELGVAPASVQ